LDDARLNQLLLEISQGSLESLNLLYQQVQKPIYYSAYALSKDPHLSQDVLQETIIRIWEKAGQYQKDTYPKAWIMTIARHYTLQLLRNRDICISYDDQLLTDNGAESAPHITDFSIEEHMTLQTVLSRLNKSEREIVILKNFSGFSHVEIAHMLQTPYGTILWRYHTAMKKLRKLMSNVL
jgi:RNA polymerase sigma factor (sigma-70 family)